MSYLEKWCATEWYRIPLQVGTGIVHVHFLGLSKRYNCKNEIELTAKYDFCYNPIGGSLVSEKDVIRLHDFIQNKEILNYEELHTDNRHEHYTICVKTATNTPSSRIQCLFTFRSELDRDEVHQILKYQKTRNKQECKYDDR